MNPVTLTLVGAALATLTSLLVNLSRGSKASASARLVLSLPLIATAWVVGQDRLNHLALFGIGQQSGEPVRFTLQYDLPDQGVGVFDAVIKLTPNSVELWGAAFALIAVCALLGSLAERGRDHFRWMSTSASIAWLTAWGWWALSAPLQVMSSAAGERGVREFLRAGPLDLQRAVRFVPPEEGWRYLPDHVELITLSILCAIGLTLVGGRPRSGDASKYTRLEVCGYGLGTLAAISGLLWSGVEIGYTGSVSQTASWGAALMMAVGSVSALPSIQRCALACLALITLCGSL